MATTETKILDNIISSRRALLVGGTAFAGLLLTKPAHAASTVTTYTDADILNFALNLEYLEANFYYLAAFGTTIDVANAKTMAAGAPTIALSATVGTKGTVSYKPNPQVPFTMPNVAAYAVETAIEEAKHVSFLMSALSSAAVAQPAIDLTGGSAYPVTAAWNTLASAATIGSAFDPFASDANFLLGAYVFEDVGVTAYHGAAPLLSTAKQPSSNLAAAAGILAVEAYHAGLVRTSINAIDAANGNTSLTAVTTLISNLRSTLSLAANSGKNSNGTTTPDDFSLAAQTVTLNGTAGVSASQLVDADANVIAFSRTTTQVLNIVTGGHAATAGTKAQGVFFPAGLNGLFS